MPTPRQRRSRWRSTSRFATAASDRASMCCCWASAAASPGAPFSCDGFDAGPLAKSNASIGGAMKLAMVFPGQGSQSVGMMSAYDAHPAVRETFAEAGRVLGQDLWALAADGPAEEINRTVNTQPLMLTADVAVYRAWLAAGGPEPGLAAGHSLGEYAALTAAGALALADALPLVRFRAQTMQEAVPAGTGAMAAVMGLDDAALAAVCAEAALG